MRTRYSIIIPIAAILTGVVLELNSLNLIGNMIPNDLLFKIWPALLIFVGLDLIITQRRLIGALVVLFCGVALLSTQFFDGGWNNEIWKFFLKVWPILLILFGIDCIFSSHSLINTAVIIAGIIILAYVLFNYLDIPALNNFSGKIDLSSILPTSDFNGVMPAQPQQNAPVLFNSNPSGTNGQISIDEQNSTVTVANPSQNNVILNLNAASGKIDIKAGGDYTKLISGQIKLDPAEKISTSENLSGQTAQYTFTSKGNASLPQESNWNLSLTAERTIAINAVLNKGYFKADLRSLNLSDVKIENKYGPIDVMVPQSTNAKITLKASEEPVRVFVPNGTSVVCIINGASKIDYPQWNYVLSENTVSPRHPGQNMITVEINSSNGVVEIIERS